MVAKLIRKVIKTNQQNHTFYGKWPLCPSYHTAEESWTHIFTCGSEGSTESHKASVTELQKNLPVINTPLAAIIYGMEMWDQSQTNQQLQVHAFTVGPCIVLMCFLLPLS
jgi:hypothetical protein